MTSMDYALDLSGLGFSFDPVKTLKPFYRITQKVSMGGYGAVFLAEDRNQREYAVKVQMLREGNYQMLVHERIILERLNFADPKGFPKVFNYLSLKEYEFLVMQRMGCSLQDLLEEAPRRRLSLKSVVMFGIQAVRRLQTLHENYVLHRDVKPGNFVIGSHGKEGTIVLIDFGISMIIDDWKTYNPDGPCRFRGTVPFAATSALLRKNPTRAGDLESLVYTLILLFTGKLPFSFPYRGGPMHDHDPISGQLAQRRRKTSEDVCRNFPDLTNFVRLVARIKEREEPNYNRLVRELERVLKQNGYENDGRFEWM